MILLTSKSFTETVTWILTLLEMSHYITLTSTISGVAATKIRYDHHQVHRVIPETEEQLNKLREIRQTNKELQFWTLPISMKVPVDIIVPPNKIKDLNILLRNFKREIYIQDLQKLINKERPKFRRSTTFDWEDYHDLEEIYSWLHSLQETYPNITSSIIGGTSYEGKDIRGVKISFKEGNPGVFIESGIHPREWIAPATATFIINELLTSNNTDVRYIAETYDWYIFPTINPDGYVYTHTTDRLWRKTVSPNNGSDCLGTDANRNWDEHWKQLDEEGDNPCEEDYAGSYAFSEIETRTMSEYMLQNDENIDIDIGEKAALSISKRYGRQYRVGSVIDIIHPVVGISTDWVMSNLNVTLNYIWELPDSGEYGFILPANQIVSVGLETLDGIVTILKEVQSYLKQ